MDKEGTDVDRREKLVCAAVERIKPTAALVTVNNKSKRVGFAVDAVDTESDFDSRPSSPEAKPMSAKLAAFKSAATATITTNTMKVTKMEEMFNIKETRKKAVAQSKKGESKADIQRYKAHLRMLNLKVNPVSREFVVHEQEWRSILPAAIEMEVKSGRPAKMVEEDAKKDPMR